STVIYPLSLHDALPISFSVKTWRLIAQATYLSLLRIRTTRIRPPQSTNLLLAGCKARSALCLAKASAWPLMARAISSQPTPCFRSEEHTSELQSRVDLV